MVAPLSTRLGKGTWGAVEGAEPLFNLTTAAAAFVQHPLKFRRVQVQSPLLLTNCIIKRLNILLLHQSCT